MRPLLVEKRWRFEADRHFVSYGLFSNDLRACYDGNQVHQTVGSKLKNQKSFDGDEGKLPLMSRDDVGFLKNACATSQYYFVKKLHMSLPNGLRGTNRVTVAPAFLLKVDPKAELVQPKKQVQYNETSMKSLWLSQRSRPGMRLSTVFHCTRVDKATTYDWNELKYLMGCLQHTRCLPLIISIDNNGDV